MTDSHGKSHFHLSCYVQGDPITNCIRIPVFSTMSISELVPKILRVYNEQAFGRKLETANIRIFVFQVDIARSELHTYGTPSDQNLLNRAYDVGDYWPNPEQITRMNIQILLKAEARPQQFGTDAISRISSDLDHHTLRQDETAEAFRVAPSASAAAYHSTLEKQQEKDTIPIFNGRPFRRTDVPIQLFHPAFDFFTTQLDQTSELPATKYAAVEAFMFASQALYSTEMHCWSVIESLLTVAVGYPIHPEGITKCQSNGVVTFTVKYSAQQAYAVIVESENEIGTGHCDPWIQAAQSFSRYWSQQKMTRLRRATRCPTFILSIAGPWMCVSGAVYLDHVVVQPLTDYIWLGRHPQQNHHLVRVTKLFEALYSAISFLRDEYHPFIKPEASLPILPQRNYPYVQRFQTSHGQVDFTYTGRLDGPDAVRPVFKGITKDGRAIVVKFAEFYNFEAHQLLASKFLAPQLLSRQPEPVGGGLVIIVMEFCGNSLDTYLGPTGAGLEPSTRERIHSDVKRALTLLHTNNLVFGDLRSPNVLVVKFDDGSLHGLLVDFEWCGIEGVARYPAGMNQSKKIGWAAGMAKGSLMLKEHDNSMLKKLFSASPAEASEE